MYLSVFFLKSVGIIFEVAHHHEKENIFIRNNHIVHEMSIWATEVLVHVF